MILVIDIGNSNVVIAAMDGARTIVLKERVESNNFDTYTLCEKFSGYTFSGSIIASVVPNLNKTFELLATELTNTTPLFVTSELNLGLKLDVENPSGVGVDRVANSVAAKHFYGAPSLVVDFGTATTFDVVDNRGNFVGGSIALGIKSNLDALATKAAKLFTVELDYPKKSLGRNTDESIRSGLLIGYKYLTEGLINALSKEVGGFKHVIATGGLAPSIYKHIEFFTAYEANLTLSGIYLVWELNKPS